MHRTIRHLVQFVLLVLLPVNSALVQAQQFVWAPDFPEGANIPLLEAPDQHGTTQTLASLSGPKGLVLLFNRSFDWCPYCKAQLDNLTTVAPQFQALGFNVATITYDSIETLKTVAEDLDTDLPLLHDAATLHVTAFGILNPAYEPGHYAYGIPLPGIMVVSPAGVILKKFAEEDYRVRPDFDLVLEAIAGM